MYNKLECQKSSPIALTSSGPNLMQIVGFVQDRKTSLYCLLTAISQRRAQYSALGGRQHSEIPQVKCPRQHDDDVTSTDAMLEHA